MQYFFLITDECIPLTSANTESAYDASTVWTYQRIQAEPQLLEHLDEYANIFSVGWNVSKLLC